MNEKSREFTFTVVCADWSSDEKEFQKEALMVALGIINAGIDHFLEDDDPNKKWSVVMGGPREEMS